MRRTLNTKIYAVLFFHMNFGLSEIVIMRFSEKKEEEEDRKRGKRVSVISTFFEYLSANKLDGNRRVWIIFSLLPATFGASQCNAIDYLLLLHLYNNEFMIINCWHFAIVDVCVIFDCKLSRNVVNVRWWKCLSISFLFFRHVIALHLQCPTTIPGVYEFSFSIPIWNALRRHFEIIDDDYRCLGSKPNFRQKMGDSLFMHAFIQNYESKYGQLVGLSDFKTHLK